MCILEICVEDAQGLATAIEAGADRIELCSNLDRGGLTPSYGLMVLAASCSVPVYALIRPRGGDFHFSSQEEQIMRRDIEAAREAGLAGVVIGASRLDNGLDTAMLGRLMAHAHPLKASLHRVFDLTPDPLLALEQAIELGLERILTSGGAVRAVEGLDLLRALHVQAAGRITIMPGAGIDSSNAAQIIAATGVDEIHASCREIAPLPDDPSIEKSILLGFAAAREKHTSANKIKLLRAAITRSSDFFATGEAE